MTGPAHTNATPAVERRWLRWWFALHAVVLLAIANNLHGGAEHWRAVLQADAKGYYAYLPALFVYRDLSFGFLEEAERMGSNPNLHYDYRVAPGGRTVNKYWSGTAVMQAPFFLVVHGAALLTGGEATGYGKGYTLAVCAAAITYALLGCWAAMGLLASFGAGLAARLITASLLLFGTHLFYYTLVAPGMGHVYGFALVSLFLWRARLFFLEPRSRSLVPLGVLLGLIVLVRPVNGLVLAALPLMAGSGETLLRAAREVRQWPWHLFAAVLCAGAIAGIQPLLYQLGSGRWWVDSYPGEGFNWGHPHLLDVLFSYKKGLFVYTPLLLLGLAGLVPLWRTARFAVIAWAGYFTVLLYVTASWWNWWYGGGFSGRPFVDHLALFALPMGFAVHGLQPRWRKAWLVCAALLTVVCQVQILQARYYRIHYEDMDRARYWEEFLRVDKLP